MQVLSGRRHRVEELVFSHCGRWLAAGGSGGGVHVWDTANPTARPVGPQPLGRVAALTFRTDGRLFFHVRSGKWYLFDPTVNELTALSSPRTNDITAAPDAQRVIRINAHSPICTWGFSPNDDPVQQLAVKSPGAEIVAAAFAPDGTTFVTVEHFIDEFWVESLKVVLRETTSGKLLGAFPGTALSTSRVRYSSRGEYLLTSWGASLACWTLAEPAKPRRGVNPNRKHFQSLAFHPEGPLLTVDNDRLVRVWDIPSLATDRTIAWNIGKLYAVAVSPDGTRAAVGSHTGKVLVWDWD